jgi:PAS domain S-box-containing protein
MKPGESRSPMDPADEISALIETLAETERRLEVLTAGEVDTVADRQGKTFLLRRAQEQLHHSEAAKQTAILNALPAHIALLDAQGSIVSVNEAWRHFATANFLHGPEFALGVNYLAVCDQARGQNSAEAHQAAAGIRAVLAGAQTFSLEYPCHSSAEQRWFLLTVTPLAEDRPNGAVVMHLNITERKLGENALRASEAEFRTLAEAMPQIVWITRPDGWNLYFNQQWMDYTGLGLEESLGHNWNKPFHPDDQQRAMQAWQHATVTVSAYSVECRLRRADGIYRWWLIRGVPIFNATGDVLKWFGTCTDIDDLKVAEIKINEASVALRLSKERLQAAISASGAGTFSWNIRTNDLDWDHSLDVLFGLPPGQTVRSLDVFLAAVHPDDRAGVIARCERCARDGADFNMEFRVIWPDGSLHWLDDRGKTIADDAGRPAHMTGACVDITERKAAEFERSQSEQWLKAFFDQPAVGVVQTDATNGRFVQFNQRFCDIVGYTREELSRLAFTDITHAQDLELNVENVRRLRTGAVRQFVQEKRYVRKDGSTVWANMAVSAIGPPGEAPSALIAFVQDISERKRLDEHLLQAQKMEALGQFSGGVAHDFNNILAAIGGYTELSQMKLQANPEVREYLGAVLQATGRAAALVRQILSFSRQQPEVRRVIELGPVVAESLKLLRATIPATIEFDQSLATDAPTVLANAGQVQQILMNLGINAWHAMKEQPGRLKMTLERCVVDEAHAAAQPRLHIGRYARLSVSDTGMGMDAATLRRIFDPFFTTKPVGEGTGLGLAVVYGIMESHDGAVTVYSQPGEGTVFHLYFPAHAGELALEVATTGETPRGHGERLLVVDDEQVLVELSQRALDSLGYATEGTTEPAAALALVRADPARFALVLTDYTMPGLTGLMLAAQLREIRPSLPIILMTGYSASLTPGKIQAAGIAQLLLKPASLPALGTAVHAALTAQPYFKHGTHTPY